MVMVVRIQEVQRSDFGKVDELIFLKFGNAEDELVDGRERSLVAGMDNCAAGGFAKPADLHSVRVEGPDKPGMTAKMARTLGDAGLSFRALSATAIGSKFVAHVALDSADDAARAAALLKKL